MAHQQAPAPPAAAPAAGPIIRLPTLNTRERGAYLAWVSVCITATNHMNGMNRMTTMVSNIAGEALQWFSAYQAAMPGPAHDNDAGFRTYFDAIFLAPESDHDVEMRLSLIHI